jgi:serine/threonine-protein kinase
MYSEGDLINDQYEVQRRLFGGFAYVYIVTDQVSERTFAIKMLKDNFEEHPEAAARFEREARHWINLGVHEHVVRAILFQRGSQPMLILEYIEGLSLNRLVGGEPAGLAIRQALSFSVQITEGLAHAHGCEVFGDKPGVIHRDLKPSNVMVNTSGTAKITDFGLSRAHADNTLTGPSPLGTLPYMPPEQWKEARWATPQSDLYSLGVMLYEMLTGTLPFRGRTVPELYHQVSNTTPRPIFEFRPDMPQDLVDLVRSCMQRDPEDRPETASDVISLLQNIQSSQPAEATDHRACWSCGYVGNKEYLRCPICASVRDQEKPKPTKPTRQCCGEDVADEFSFCMRCGKPVDEQRSCTACGAELPPGHKFCGACGVKLPDE